MAIKVSFEVNMSKALQKALRNSAKPIDTATAKEVGQAVVSKMKSLIAVGSSPIDGKGKFPKYKDPKRYPGKRKAHSPVNLHLSGKFLEALKSDVISGNYGYGASIFFEGDDQEIKEKGHREGANGQPKRPTIPASKGQEFVASIEILYTNIFRNRILRVLNGED